ncbi:ABC transporter permease [Nocardioides antri]
MGASVHVEGLTKTFGRQNIWRDVSFELPAGEITALLGPSGTGKSVLLKALMGLVTPEAGSAVIDGVDVVTASQAELEGVRRGIGVLFQDGALFGSMTLRDNVAFPLREHTRMTEAEIRARVGEKLDLVGLLGAEHKLPGEVSGGMRKRAGLARSLVLEPELVLCDEPDSGLDPVRTAFLAQLLVDVNAQTDATVLVVTHNIDIAATLPDNLGMLFRKELVMFGPREAVLTTDDPTVVQFLHGGIHGPIGMAEEADRGRHVLRPTARFYACAETLAPQLVSSPGLPDRVGAARHAARVRAAGDVDALVVRQPPPDVERPDPPLPPSYGPVLRGTRNVGSLYALALDVIRLMLTRRPRWREVLEQFWFVASVSILPAALVAIPFGAVIALQLGTLTVQIGAQSFTGAASVLAVIQQASPIVTCLAIAGAGGAAICADLGARTIREEIDAMKVLGISPVERLVVPRVVAAMGVAALLNGLVSVVGVAGGYVFNVVVQGGTPGAYLSSFTALAQIADLFVGEIKALIFGFLAGVVAAHCGLNPAPGPKGVGDAVNKAVVVTFLLLFFVNFVVTTLYLQIVPAKGA